MADTPSFKEAYDALKKLAEQIGLARIPPPKRRKAA